MKEKNERFWGVSIAVFVWALCIQLTIMAAADKIVNAIGSIPHCECEARPPKWMYDKDGHIDKHLFAPARCCECGTPYWAWIDNLGQICDTSYRHSGRDEPANTGEDDPVYEPKSVMLDQMSRAIAFEAGGQP